MEVALAQETVGSSEVVAFHHNVAPFLKKYCLRCHGPDHQAGRIALHEIFNEPAADRHLQTWSRVFEKLTAREMPPEDELIPEERDRELVTDWIRRNLPPAAVTESSYSLARFGNQIPHAQLFDAPPAMVAMSPPRIWRIRPLAYQKLLAAVSGKKVIAVTEPFALDSQRTGFRDYAALYQLDEPSLQLLIRNADAVAVQMTSTMIKDGRLTRASAETPEEVLEILEPANRHPTVEQIELAIIRHFHRVLQRDPTEEECRKLLTFTRSGIERLGRLRGIRNMISAVLLTPEALFRIEAGQGEPDRFGRVILSPREIAYAVSYALTDDRPDAALIQAVKNGSLSSREQVRDHVKRILTDHDIARPRILQFFREYFGYDKAVDVFKDKAIFPHHNPVMLVHDTDHLILFILQKDRDVLRELLTTTRSYVNVYDSPSGKVERATMLYAHHSYNLPHEWEWTPQQPVKLPDDQRAGILTQPSWLVAHSGNFENNVIRRGKWIRERLLGGTVPDLPISVDARLPDDDSLTLRDRMRVTRQPYCWNCHQQMDPLGLPFEQYDHFGRWRTRELDSEVVTTGSIDRSGDDSLDGPVSGPLQMIRKLADSPQVRQVFIRHAFRYWMGRDETLTDAAALQQADRNYVDSGGSMNALILSLLTSDSFLYREGAEDNVAD